MELLQLLLYTTAFTQLSYTSFFTFCSASLFLRFAYYNKPTCIKHEFDFSSLIICLTHVILRLMEIFISIFVKIVEKNQYGFIIVNNYNNLNNHYLILRKKTFDYVVCGSIYVVCGSIKYVFKKVFLPDIPQEEISALKKLMITDNNKMITDNKKSIKELKTDKEIIEFLNKFSSTTKTD